MAVNWNKIGMVAGGFLLGTYGVKILGSSDAKSLYTHCTAGVLRMKDEVVKDFTNLRENAGDIAADAKEINEERAAKREQQIIENAKAVLDEAKAKSQA